MYSLKLLKATWKHKAAHDHETSEYSHPAGRANGESMF